MRTNVRWAQGMAFDAELDGHSFMMDADPAFGGTGKGPRPKGLVLTALAGCTAMDVVAILAKMRIEPAAFSVDVQGELAAEHPKVFTRVHITYRFEGDDLPREKLDKAVALSQEKYCAVSAMLIKAVPVTHEIVVEAQHKTN